MSLPPALLQRPTTAAGNRKECAVSHGVGGNGMRILACRRHRDVVVRNHSLGVDDAELLHPSRRRRAREEVMIITWIKPYFIGAGFIGDGCKDMAVAVVDDDR